MAARVVRDYRFDKTGDHLKDFNHTIGIDRRTIIEFDRNHPGLTPAIRQKLRVPCHRFWRIPHIDEFITSIGNLYGYVDKDTTLDKIDGLTYRPWIGRDYFGQPVKDRILVVAESVYTWGNSDEENERLLRDLQCDRNFARAVVRDHGLWARFGIDSLKGSNIARGTERAMTGKKNLTPSEQYLFWRSISFHGSSRGRC